MSSKKAASNKDMNGLKVVNLGSPTPASSDAARISDVEAGVTAAESRANHTGTQTAATISDFNTQVRTSRLDQMAAPTSDLSLNTHKLTNVVDPTNDSDAANKAYVDAQLSGVVSGQVLKGSVRAVSTTNVNVASAPATIDGITPSNGDVFLLAGQTAPAENGPYVWTASGSAMTRAPNWNSDAEAVLGSYWIVREGSKADNFALLTNDTAITLGTSSPAFTYFSSAASSTPPYETNIGDGSSVSFSVPHAFGTRAILVSVRRVASPYDEIDVYNRCPDVNTVVIEPDSVFSTNEFHVVVSKA